MIDGVNLDSITIAVDYRDNAHVLDCNLWWCSRDRGFRKDCDVRRDETSKLELARVVLLLILMTVTFVFVVVACQNVAISKE